MGELFSDRNGDGLLRKENTMLPMLTFAHMQVDCGCLNDCIGKPVMPAGGRLGNRLRAIQDRSRESRGALIAAIHLPDQTSHTPPRQYWRGFLLKETALISLDIPPAD